VTAPFLSFPAAPTSVAFLPLAVPRATTLPLRRRVAAVPALTDFFSVQVTLRFPALALPSLQRSFFALVVGPGVDGVGVGVGVGLTTTAAGTLTASLVAVPVPSRLAAVTWQVIA